MTRAGEEDSQPLLSSVTIILVRPQNPGNVGAAARVVRNFGLAGLALVVDEPDSAHRTLTDAESLRFAHRSEDVLRETAVFPTLRDSLASCHWSAAASGRYGRERGEPDQIRSAAARLAWQAECGPGAIVFGPEADGLNESEIALCDEVVRVPQYRPGPALNLAQAVAVIASELFTAAMTPGTLPPRDFAPSDSIGRLVSRMNRAARHCGLTVRNRPEEMIEALSAVFLRHEFDSMEVAVLERWLSQIEWFTGITATKSWDRS